MCWRCFGCCDDIAYAFFCEKEYDSDEDLDDKQNVEDEEIPDPDLLPGNRSLEEEYPNLAPLFASNDVPMAAHASVVREILRDRNASLFSVKSKLSEIRSEVSRINAMLQRLKRQRRALYDRKRSLRKDIRQCAGVIAPIRRLPPEVLGEIFSYFAPVLVNEHRFDLAEHNYRKAGYMKPEIPWYLGQICHYWRTVALSIRSLWSVFDLRIPSHEYVDCRIYSAKYSSGGKPVFDEWEEAKEYPWKRNFWNLPDLLGTAPCEDEVEEELWATGDTASAEPQALEDFIRIASCITPSLNAAEQCLQWSGEAPISARVIYHDSPHTLPFFNALLRHSHRLRDLRLVDVPQDILDRFSESCSRYQRLRSLAVIFTAVISPLILDCPSSLVNLHLTSIYLTTATHHSIPWAQLLKYCEHDCVWDDHDDRWASYRQLSSAIELCVQFSKSAQKPQSPILFPKLRHARLSFQGEQQKEILHSFEAPVLVSLSCDHNGCHFPEVRLRHSLPHLKSLRVRFKCSDRDSLNIEHIMEMCPNLTEIFVHATEARALDLVTGLFSTEDSHLDSKLAVIRLALDHRYRYYEYDKILKAVKSSFRSDSSQKREVVLYDRRHDYDSEGSRRMHEDLKDQGMNVSFRSLEQGDLDFVECHWHTDLH